METVPDQLRNQVQAFYAAIRSNDAESVETMLNDGFPIKWAQAFAETSLPEFAMRQGAVETSWLLMSKGLMPEKWSDFSGDAWKVFLKKGWDMTVSKDGAHLSIESYAKIAKIGLKVTGQQLPGWLDKVLTQSTTGATKLTDSMMSKFSGFLSRVRENMDDNKRLREPSSIEIPEKSVDLSNQNGTKKPSVLTKHRAKKRSSSKDGGENTKSSPKRKP